jgi:hypothetical protein
MNLYASTTDALIAQRMSSPLDEQIARTRPRRRSARTVFRPSRRDGGLL